MSFHDYEPLWNTWYIRKRIGTGSFGTVYRAQETILGHTNECAVKHITIPKDDAELQDMQQQLSQSFTQDIDVVLRDEVESAIEEYETQCQFNDLPNFVHVHNILVQEKKDIPGYDVFIRMELLNSIDTRFKSGSVNEQEVIRLGIDICTALVEMQKRNLVHRDIKPQNILVSDNGIYKLSDFGSVRKTNGTATAMTMKGTFDYTAPEVLNGTLADSRVDIYSLGVVMYQLLNNHMLPPARLPGDKLEMLRSVSSELSNIVLKACEYDADKRWKSAEDMLDALRQIGNTKKPHKSTKQNWLIPFIASCAILAVSLGLLISGILKPKPTDEIIPDLETKLSDLNSQHSAELKTVTDEKDALAAQVQELTDNAAKAADEAAANLKTVTDEKNALAAQVQELTDNAAKAADEAAANLKTVTDEKDALAAQVQELTDNAAKAADEAAANLKTVTDEKNALAAQVQELTNSAAKASDEAAATLKAVTDEKNALAAQVQSLSFAADFANMNEDELKKTVDKLSEPLRKIGFEIKETNNQIIDIGKKPENTIASGKWGTCEWWIDQAGTLVITEGTGSNTYSNKTAPWGKNADAIRTVMTTGTVNAPPNCSYLFSDLVNCISMDLGQFNTQRVTHMENMFYHCTNLSSLNLSSFDTSNVIDMHGMFSYCYNLSSLNLSSFDTSHVINMLSMFSCCTNLSSLNLRSFNTQNVTDMTAMFSHCANLPSLDLSNFSTDKVTKMISMFSHCAKLSSIDLSSFNTSHVTSMRNMFSYCAKLSSIDLSKFNTSRVTNMNGMFSYCTSLSSLDLSSFNTSNVTEMSNMFRDCSSLSSLDLRSFTTSKVIDKAGLLSSCAELNTLVLGPNFVFSDFTYYLSGTWKSDQSNKLYPGESLLKSHPQGTTATYTKVKE